MRLFQRKSKWDRVLDSIATSMAKGGVRRLSKATAGFIGGVAAATAASAAISSIRHKGDS
jgi:hypothetical protein